MLSARGKIIVKQVYSLVIELPPAYLPKLLPRGHQKATEENPQQKRFPT